jgi:hypothetical protein
MRRVNRCFVLVFSLAALLSVHAQDDFGFGFGSEDEGSGEALGSAYGSASGDSLGFASGPSGSFITGASVGGEAKAELLFYAKEFESAEAFRAIRPGNIFSGALNFKASASNADAVVNLKLRGDLEDPSRLLSLDEAYIRAFYGSFTVEGGIRKLTWGKADSLGPLDVINPLDYSDLSAMSDIQSIKIARPLIHASYDVGSFSKVEGVFVPWFQGHRFAQSANDRWTPAQVGDMQREASSELALLSMLGVAAPTINPSEVKLDTSTLEYAQGGLRFTTTIGSSDFGLQYYNGYLPRPAVVRNDEGVNKLTGRIMPHADVIISASSTLEEKQVARAAIDAMLATLDPNEVLRMAYTRYHQIGVDYAQVIAGFNCRAELAGHLTEDLAGDDGLVYNPFLAWSLGFDRDVFAGLNVNLQVNESIRLLNGKVGSDPLTDIEAGADLTSTRMTLALSKKFFRDELELKTTAIWGIEDMDCYILPAVVWTKGEVALELSGGIFAGKTDGELGQYRDNGFIRTALTYSF